MDRETMINLYKSRNDLNKNLENKRNKDITKLKVQRQDRRTRLFNERRSIQSQENIENISGNVSSKDNDLGPSKDNSRKLALQKYRLEKEAIKRATNLKKRPPFVVGIPHHGNSPILKKIGIPKKQTGLTIQQNSRNLRVTRANSKQEKVNEPENVFKSPVRVFPFKEQKSKFTFNLIKGGGVKKLTSPQTPTVLKRSAQKIEQPKRKITTNVKKEVKSTTDKVVLNKVPKQKKKLSTNSTDSVSSLAAPLPNNAIELTNNNEQIIQKDEASLSLTNCDAMVNPGPSRVTMESNNEEANALNVPNTPERQIEIKSEISEELEEYNSEARLQREKVDDKSEMLLSLAEEWESMGLQNSIPQDVVDEIDSVVGQTRLLTKDKFNQFRRLVDEYESGRGSHKITVEDLNGFWDMVYLQVEALIRRYTNLEVLKNNNWEELKSSPFAKKKKNEKRKVKKAVKKCISDHQESVMPKVNDSIQQGNLSMPSIDEKIPPRILTLSRQSHTPRRYSPAPYIAMRLSGVGRSSINTPEVQPFECTPSPKSILKKEIVSGGSTSKKSVALNMSSLDFEADTVPNTPRRSVRLLGRTPVSLVKLCASCQSPECQMSSCGKVVKARSRHSQKKSPKPAPLKEESMLTDSSNSDFHKQTDKGVTLRRSRQSKRLFLSPNPESEIMQMESSNLDNIHEEDINEAGPLRKKFVLRPSKLILSDTNKTPVREKTGLTYHGGKENSSPIAEDVMTSSSVRRSTRLASAKKVTFSSNSEEKSNFKLPATPFAKRGNAFDE